MRISNKRKFNKINLCDLMKELGRNFACLEINKAFITPPHSKNHSAQGFEGCVVMNCNKNSELKTNSPRPMLGEENSQFEQLRKLENLVRVHSDYYKYCHSVLDTESEVGEWTNTNENISLLPMKWEKMSERQMRIKHRHKPSPIFYALNNSCKNLLSHKRARGIKNVIASVAKQSQKKWSQIDCFVVSLLAMTVTVVRTRRKQVLNDNS